ncbi:MAG: NYN domain-containing protein [Chloroflexota bacterium]
MRYLVDGHNLIGALPQIELADPNDEAKLVVLLRKFCNRTSSKVHVVFDGALVAGVSRGLSGGPVAVQFTSGPQGADRAILKRMTRIKDKGAWTIVSSDRRILDQAERLKLGHTSSAEFASRLDDKHRSEEEQEKPTPIGDDVDYWLEQFDS